MMIYNIAGTDNKSSKIRQIIPIFVEIMITK